MRLTFLLRTLVPTLLAIACFGATPLAAQSDKVAATLYTRAEGGVIRAAIAFEIEPDWHLYHDELGHPDAVGKPTVIELEGVTWSAPRFPEPDRLEQPGMMPDGSDGWIFGHHGEIVVYAAGRIAAGAAPPQRVSATIDALACLDDGACIPYRATLTSAGPGPDGVFADFPDDLEPPPGAEPGAGSSAAAKDEEAPPRGAPVAGGKATFRLFTRVVEGDERHVQAVIEVEIADDWHLYHDDIGDPGAAAKPTVVTFGEEAVTASAVRFPEPDPLIQEGLGAGGSDIWTFGHHGRVRIHAAARLAPDAAPSEVVVGIDGLTCQDDGSCIPFDIELVSMGSGSEGTFDAFPEDLLPPEGEPGAAGRPEASPEALVGESDPAAAASLGELPEWDYVPRERGIAATGEMQSLWLFMLFAFIAGAILNVMPCVLPVVSIKVLSFVNQAGESRGRVFALGSAFAAGILVVFLVLGSLAALLGLGWGEQFNTPAFLIVMTGIVFGFALSLFGVYELGVPQAVGQMVGTQRREGLGGAFAMGVLSTILATPCSGPFLGSTLAWAVTQPGLVVFSIFAMAGLGMAAPYLVLTSNPKFLKYVPKPGAWMETFKHLTGFLLLATALFLMVSLPAELVLYTLLFLLFVALGCWIWGRYATFDQKPARRVGTLASALSAIAIGAWLSFAALPAFLHVDETYWEPFDARKLAQYHAEGRNVFVDWTADWCLTCKTNERMVYHTDEVMDAFRAKGFALMIADETGGGALKRDMIELRKHLGSDSIPFAAVFPADQPQEPFILRDLVLRDDFLELLELVPTGGRPNVARP